MINRLCRFPLLSLNRLCRFPLFSLDQLKNKIYVSPSAGFACAGGGWHCAQPCRQVDAPFLYYHICQEQVRKLEHEAQTLRREMIQLNAELGERDTKLDDERRARQRAEEKARYVKLFSPPPVVYFLPLPSSLFPTLVLPLLLSCLPVTISLLPSPFTPSLLPARPALVMCILNACS